jgi:protein-disulfide isomerase
VRIVFRDFPLSFHQDAQLAAEAARCAHDQGKFWEYHDKLFANQRALKEENLKQYAAELELDGDAFSGCLLTGKFRVSVTQEMREGQAIGVTGTPAFFINGRFLSGAQPFEAFAKIIDEEFELKGIENPRTKGSPSG